MSETYKFLKECGVFFVTTVNAGKPAVRPFGAVMEYGGELYFCTSNTKDVYREIKINSNVQIAAIKSGTREWIRISGSAEEIFGRKFKVLMFETCPVLNKIYASEDAENFALFKLNDIKSLIYSDNGAKVSD